MTNQPPPTTSSSPSIWPLVKFIVFSGLTIFLIWSLYETWQNHLVREDYNKTQVALATIDVLDTQYGISNHKYFDYNALANCIKSRITPGSWSTEKSLEAGNSCHMEIVTKGLRKAGVIN